MSFFIASCCFFYKFSLSVSITTIRPLYWILYMLIRIDRYFVRFTDKGIATLWITLTTREFSVILVGAPCLIHLNVLVDIYRVWLYYFYQNEKSKKLIFLQSGYFGNFGPSKVAGAIPLYSIERTKSLCLLVAISTNPFWSPQSIIYTIKLTLEISTRYISSGSIPFFKLLKLYNITRLYLYAIPI